MKKFLLSMVVIFSCAWIYAQENEKGIDANELFEQIIKEHRDQPLNFGEVEPDGKITDAILSLMNLQTMLNVFDSGGVEELLLPKKIERAITVLSERRIYKYQMWAEQRLRENMSEKDLTKCSDSRKVALYISLSQINQNVISEIMLHREVIERLKQIYDVMNEDTKKHVRLRAIQLQQDEYTLQLQEERKNNRRLTLEDF
ncbi:hypothetical protein [Fibrobacter sp.]|uniref:hypothetical protein n=1 Tax=Fibrobacter sp. TaxID=35828 RepID=UPI00388E21B1